MRIRNRSRFAAEGVVDLDVDGRERWLIAVKALVTLDEDQPRTVEAAKIVRADRFAASGALEEAADMRAEEVGTDVLLRGTAIAPSGPASSFSASIRIGDRAVAMRCSGPRRWRRDGDRAVASEPEPVATVALAAELAFGGAGERRNPAGRGFMPSDDTTELERVELPLLEWSDDLLQDPAGRPEPAVVSGISPHWLPRLAFAGTYDASWARSRAPLPARDRDARFFCAATERLWFAGGLRGGEALELENLGRPGRRTWTLPRLAPRLFFEGTWIVPRLDLVVLDVDRNDVTLTFGAALDIDGRIDDRLALDVTERMVAPLGGRAGAIA